jgi:GDP-4-dehydro-6-deoxy-D-mannose reductase
MPRALVTGAGGFIGRHVVAELKRRGIDVQRLRFRSVDDGSIEPRFRLGDNSESRRLVDLLRQAEPDVILHLAGTVESRFLFDVNVGYAVRLIEGLRRTGLTATLLLVGSAAEYGRIDEDELPVSESVPCRPFTPYGISKHAQTLAGLTAAAAGSRVIVARVFNVVGLGMPRHLPLRALATRLAESEVTGELAVGSLDLERDFIDVADVAESLVGLAFHPEADGVLNLCCGHGVWLRQLVERMVAGVPWPVSLVTDERLAGGDLVRRMVGNPDRLAQLGLTIPPPEFDAVLPAVVAEAIRNRELLGQTGIA